MHRIITLLAAFVLLFGTTRAQAQSPQSFDWTASVVVTPFLSCTVARHLDFGAHFRTEGVLFSSIANSASLNCETDPGNAIDVSFTLPPSLARVGGGGAVPITYGVTSATILNTNGIGYLMFNPATGVSGHVAPSNGVFDLNLGFSQAVGPDEALVSVDLTGAIAGAYSNTIIVTIAIS